VINRRIRKVDANGIISTVAGKGVYGFSGDGGAATTASMSNPSGVAVDAVGNLFIADYGNHRIRKVDTNGLISTVAGNGTAAFSGDGGAATNASLNYPSGVAVDGMGYLFIADGSNHRIRRVALSDNGSFSPTLSLNGLAVANSGNYQVVVTGAAGSVTSSIASLLILDPPVITKQPTNQMVAAGTDLTLSVSVSGTEPLSYQWFFNGTPLTNDDKFSGVTTSNLTLTALTASEAGLYSVIVTNQIGAMAASNAALSVIYPPVITSQPTNQTVGIGTTARLSVSASGVGSLNYQWLFNGEALQDGISVASVPYPNAVAVDASGNVFISESLYQRILKVDPNGIITVVAGNSTAAFSGDGGPATNASLNYVSGMAVDGAGNLFIADCYSHRIRKVDSGSLISTVVGNGTAAFSGDGGPATNASLNFPNAVEVDANGNLFIADYDNHRIRKVAPDGLISTVAGDGTGAFSGDGGLATNASLFRPVGVKADVNGNLFIVDYNNHRIRKVAPDGLISTVAGNGIGAFSGDGGPATSASLKSPSNVAVDRTGTLFIADWGNGYLRKVSPTGLISTVAVGGGPATNANRFFPMDVVLDSSGHLFTAEIYYNRVRKLWLGGYGSQSPVLTLPDLTSSSSGTYQVVVANLGGSVTSSSVVLTVVSPPALGLSLLAGSPVLHLNGMVSNSFVVQYNTNLAGTNWTTLQRVPNLLTNPHPILDPAGFVSPARFYRVWME
jgi:sugar lactone lactonase YvrE